MAGRRRGKALAVFSGIVEQMGTVKGVQLKEMVLWSGDTGKGAWNGVGRVVFGGGWRGVGGRSF